jgi:SAM-dependent methyltransferase
MKAEKALYDSVYRTGGYQGVYHLPYRHSSYYPLFKRVVREIQKAAVRHVLEVGCGNGALAQFIHDRARVEYHGFDVSAVAIEMAKGRVARDVFYVGDALNKECYNRFQYDCIVCTEVLEHMDRDREVVSHWRPGSFAICSVPSFDSSNHVRHFSSENEVHARYKDLVSISKIIRIKKPVISDITLRNRLRQLRWNRHRPHRIIPLLGLGRFDDVGGWFLFVGTRRGRSGGER